MNLTRQITLILAISITVAVFAAVVPVYVIVRAEMFAQLDQRLRDAQSNIQRTFEFERREVESLVKLAAGRPTLVSLIQSEDSVALAAYLADFKANTSLDWLNVTDPAHALAAGAFPSDSALTLAYTAAVGESGLISGGLYLDAAFAADLKQQSGIDYRFEPEAGMVRGLQTAEDGQRYYQDTVSLQPYTGDPLASLTIMLPVSGLAASETKFIVLLAISTLCAAGLVSLGGGLYMRQRIGPLWSLTAAARRIGRGDLATPVSSQSQTLEIRTLAEVLERMRDRLQRTLRELSEAKDWSEALIQSISEGIITFDARGVIVFFSEGAGRIAKLEPVEAVGQPINLVLSSVDEGRFTDFVPPEGARRSVLIRTAAGYQITAAMTRARQTDSGQTTIVLHDITEETQRHSLQAYFLAHVSHEFRTPLASMKVSVELLLENARHLSAAELNELLSSLYLSISSLQNLIDNLLESSKIEASRFTLRRQPLQFNQILCDALRYVQPFFNRRHQRLTLEQPLSLPVIRADATRLTQVLVNLLSNASKYSPLHTPVELRVELRDDALYVAVCDQGQGVPADQRENVFRAFVRLESTTTSEYSSGLGLAVVKAIIEAHSGQVGIDTRPEGGSIFWFLLPLKEPIVHEDLGR